MKQFVFNTIRLLDVCDCVYVYLYVRKGVNVYWIKQGVFRQILHYWIATLKVDK